MKYTPQYLQRVTDRKTLQKVRRQLKWLIDVREYGLRGFQELLSERSYGWMKQAYDGRWDQIMPTPIDVALINAVYSVERFHTTNRDRIEKAIKHLNQAVIELRLATQTKTPRALNPDKPSGRIVTAIPKSQEVK